MSNTIICGLQWGDEGKGKTVDYLMETADIVARGQGGNNRGGRGGTGGRGSGGNRGGGNRGGGRRS